ncbi:PREDICTED: uncharacterized protein LOC109210432 [Nicotiana attenuata]|uniref:uncharacterized protein LOC109210432 n=1 Tax=Nicotiana attenuata TaxID=49451 RepID=UPI0009047584|nr:PREDICTED: uncharacterized protein LOC109210432 [Nicotiana attenuata]
MGPSKENIENEASGVVFRNGRGDWILGYLNSAIAYTPAYMELLALKTGLQLACDKKFVDIEIETDATDVTTEKIAEFAIRHNFREGNKVAHFLATQGFKQSSSSTPYLMEQPPNSLLQALHNDKTGSTYSRTISNAAISKLVEFGNPFVTGTTNVDNMLPIHMFG